MTYKETIEEVWNNWIKDPQDRKKYTIRNKDYTPLNAKKEEFFGRNIPAHWENFRLGVLRKDGYFDIVDFNRGKPLHYCVGKIEELGIVVYDDLEEPRALNLNLIESENWELIEMSNAREQEDKQ